MSSSSLSRFLDSPPNDKPTIINDHTEQFLKSPSLDFIDNLLLKQDPLLVNTSDTFKFSTTRLVTYGETNQKVGPLMILNSHVTNYHDKKTDTIFKFKLWQE